MTADLLAAALEYAAQGIPVFPCNPKNKSPLISGGFKAATIDVAQVTIWWRQWPNAMIGMPTGPASGVWVLDVDDPQAFEGMGIASQLPPTRRVKTGKGYHLHWLYDKAEVRNVQRSNTLPGTDVRGDGGYVILPPSLHPSGRQYAWEDPRAAVPAPSALLAIVTKQAKPDQKSNTVSTIPPHPSADTDSSAYLHSLEAACWNISTATEGTQERTLNNMALQIGHLVREGKLSIGVARSNLCAAGRAMHSYDSRDPWTPEKIAKKVDHGLADGAESPPAPVDDGDIVALDWSALADVEPRAKQFVIPGLAPAGEVTLFNGPGSAGKSLWAQQVATALAAGVATLGLQMGQGSAIYLTCEDDAGQLHWREDHICKALGVPIASLSGKLFVASLRGRLDNALGVASPQGAYVPSPAYERLAALIRRTGAKLVALDNVAHLFTANENDRGAVTQFVNVLNRLAGETGAAIVLLGHPNKSGDTYSGSTAWLNAVRSQIHIDHDINTDMRTLTVGKANYARKGGAIRFVWVDWAFRLESELPPDTFRALAETSKASNDDSAFLRCLEICTVQQRNVSHQPGINYAPKIFAGMPDAKGMKPPAFAAAMERLLHSGKIVVDVELWRGKYRHPKRGIKAVEADHAE